MNVNQMKKIDYYIGMPLCFLLSKLSFVLKTLCFKEKKTKPVKKILFIKLSELGAIVLAYPLLNRVKKTHPKAGLFFVTFEKNKDIFALLDGIIPEKNILTLREDSLWAVITDILKTTRRIRKEKIDIIFDLEFFSRLTAILSYLYGAAKRIGFHKYAFEGLYRGELLTHKMQYNPVIHITKNYLGFSQAMTDESKNTPEMQFPINEEDIVFPKYSSKAAVKERLWRNLRNINPSIEGRFILLNAGEGIIPLREWPLENFIKLSRMLLEELNYYIILIGTKSAGNKANLILNAINNPKCLGLIGKTSLSELMELFCSAKALISNDCGLVHLAMLTSIRKFVFFGPESPVVFSPLGQNNSILYSNWPCSPCLSAFNHRSSTCADNNCLKVIKPNVVYNLIMKALKDENQLESSYLYRC